MRKRVSQEDLKKQKAGDVIVKKKLAIKAKIKEYNKKLEDLQNSCPHYQSWYQNKGNSGSWDRDDSYWREYECEDCGKTWTTDQGIDQDKTYPHAVEEMRSYDGEWKEYRW